MITISKDKAKPALRIILSEPLYSEAENTNLFMIILSGMRNIKKIANWFRTMSLPALANISLFAYGNRL